MAALKRVTGPLGMEWILTKWSAPGPWQNEARQLMPQGVDGFASYWVETVANMSAVGLCPEHLDLMNEPDSNGQWSLVRKHTVPSLFPSAILTFVPSLSWQIVKACYRRNRATTLKGSLLTFRSQLPPKASRGWVEKRQAWASNTNVLKASAV